MSEDRLRGHLPQEREPTDSPLSCQSAPKGVVAKPSFGAALKDSACGLMRQFSESPALLSSLRMAIVPKGRVVTITLEDVTQQCKSADSTKKTFERASGLIKFSSIRSMKLISRTRERRQSCSFKTTSTLSPTGEELPLQQSDARWATGHRPWGLTGRLAARWFVLPQPSILTMRPGKHRHSH